MEQERKRPAAYKGYEFHVRDVDNIPDLHGNPTDAKLVLFIGGNHFFVLPQLVAGFEKLHPELAVHIYYETLLPGKDTFDVAALIHSMPRARVQSDIQ